jgi:exopolyphosphatase/guanosine-5'-triphosphate,3'-diphosphate pyrophosphatase
VRKQVEQFAAIDLGSNSFHLVVVREEEHGLTVIDREREMVRLAAGLNKKNKITEKAAERALDCLARFGQRLRGLEPENVRIVGTNALRNAKNSARFIRQAEKALGYSIEIISGVEEARLIYLGVAQTLQGERGRRLVVDIGGGSTEIIVGDKSDPIYLESLYMGCVGSSENFFPEGKYSRNRMRRAILNACLELEPNIATLQSLAAKDIIGTSGTARAIEQVLRENGWSDTGITLQGLEKIVDAIVDARQLKELNLNGLSDDRRPVFAGGVAVMMAIFKTLDIQFMRISDGALREGVLHDLIGRVRFKDKRATTVLELMKRHHIDAEQAERVRKTALALFKQVGHQRLLKRERRLLNWAAQLHEIGLMIAHSQYHRHGGYVLENMDLPGFSRQEQRALSILVYLHRHKYYPKLIENSIYVRSDALSLMVRLLRIAVLINRGRAPIDMPKISISVDDALAMKLEIDESWLENHPLTTADLEQEIELLHVAGINLQLIKT